MSNRIVPSALYACVLLAALAFAPGAQAELRADQKAAVDKVLASVEPSMREMLRPQIEQSVMYLTPEQVTMFVKGVENSAKNDGDAAPAPIEEEPKQEASPEDLAYNRKQYEPAIRKNWEARKAFDDFVDAQLQTKCPNRDQYAVYREAERYELMELSPNWQRASWNPDAEVQVWGSTYVPQDGRYNFDFSKVRNSFDKEKVAAAISQACAAWTKEAVTFKQKASALMNSGQSEAALQYERTASASISAINERLKAVLDAEGPAGNYNSALLQALQNPTPAK